MVYLGAKTKLWDSLKPVILEHVEEATFYWEPFAGGMNCITHVPNTLQRIASDIDIFVIRLWQGLKRGWVPPYTICSREEYARCRFINNEIARGLLDPSSVEEHDLFLIACWRYLASFSARPYEGWNGLQARDYYTELRNNLMKHFARSNDLQSIYMLSGDYRSISNTLLTWYRFGLNKARRGIIYCDIPYYQTKPYKNYESFDHVSFWQWAREVRNMGHWLYISEYQVPEDFTCVWTKQHTIGMQTTGEKHVATECLYI
jgi:DNA adenine methylase